LAYVPIVNGQRLEFLYTWAGQRCETVLHLYSPSGVAGPTGLAAQNALWITWFAENVAPILSEELTLRAVRNTDLNTESSPVVETAPSSPVVGGISGDSVPTNVAVVATKRTAKRGRSYRGRIYTPAVPLEDESTPTDVSSASLADILTAWGTAITQAVAQEVVLGVASYFLNGVARSAGVITPITTIDGNTAFDSQRRRLAGRGN